MNITIPWGSWDLGTGQWVPNDLLNMSAEDQDAQNIANGYSCEHRKLKAKCLYCHLKET